MALVHRRKHSFTAGEVSPLMTDRVDFDRHQNGSYTLKNMVCLTQGPVTRRPGFRFIYDLGALGLNTSNPKIRIIPFIFNESQSYAMIVFMHTSGPRIVFGTDLGLVTDTGNVVYLNLPSGWDIDNFDYAQSGDFMYCAQSGKAPHYIQRNSHTSWSVTQITFASQPSIWSDANGWPERVTFHQQRLVYGSTTLKRQTIWMSKAGSFHDFGTSGTLVDSDGVSFTLDSGTQNKIKWMVSAKGLYAGTMGNEWTVTGSSQNALTPTNILAQRQTSKGSEGIKPLAIDDRTLFVEQFGRSVNEFVYNYSLDYSGGFETNNITILAPHLTEFYSITSWAYQATPYSIIWSVRGDGKLLGLTYQRQHKVIGWHHHDTLGAFLSVSAIPGSYRETTVWAAVKRILPGGTKYYIEQMDTVFNSEEAEWARFLDSFITYLDVPATVFTGLSHLEGLSVSIIADGAIIPDQVVASGTVTLPYAASHVTIGLSYVSEVVPCVPDIDLKDGTALGRMQQICCLDVELFRTVGLTVGRYINGGTEKTEDIIFRTPTDPLGGALPLYTGIKRISFVEGWDSRTLYFLRKSDPLPLTILGVMDVVEVTE
jgi:hypothetical protein